RNNGTGLQRGYTTRKRGEKRPEASPVGLIFILFAIIWLPMVQMGKIHMQGNSALIIGIAALVIGGILNSLKALRSSAPSDGKSDVLYYFTEIGTVIGFAAGLIVAITGQKPMLQCLIAGVVAGGVCGWLFGYTRKKNYFL
ncbi:hypothetical protein, partial [Baileyella intestinalis]|uniref:hypothetical protein n=1 Tax=Baileyella intestinalis TaxID=2606709 RepID=UPI003A84E1BC